MSHLRAAAFFQKGSICASRPTPHVTFWPQLSLAQPTAMEQATMRRNFVKSRTGGTE